MEWITILAFVLSFFTGYVIWYRNGGDYVFKRVKRQLEEIFPNLLKEK